MRWKSLKALIWENMEVIREILVLEANKKWEETAWIEKAEHTMFACQNVIMTWFN